MTPGFEGFEQHERFATMPSDARMEQHRLRHLVDAHFAIIGEPSPRPSILLDSGAVSIAAQEAFDSAATEIGLVVGAGGRLSFAEGRSRKDVDPKVVQLANTWDRAFVEIRGTGEPPLSYFQAPEKY